jgi:bifunctional non-homologous end joining protein LigD
MSAPLMFSGHIVGNGQAFFEQVCERKLEGVISKKRDSLYRAGRSRLWVKTKCLGREEFVIVGYTNPEGSRIGFGSLLLGYYTPQGELLFAGRAGTGFPDRMLKEITAKLKKLEQPKMPLARLPSATGNRYGFGSPFKWSEAHWVKPRLVAEISYLNWTADGFLRHVVFLGLREDKTAREVVREPPG